MVANNLEKLIAESAEMITIKPVLSRVGGTPRHMVRKLTMNGNPAHPEPVEGCGSVANIGQT